LLNAIAHHPSLRGGSWSPLDLHGEDLIPVVERLLAPYPALFDRRSQILIALEEARGNIARHAKDPSGGLSFVHHRTPERATLEFLFADAGKGFRIDNTLPPYPAEMIGHVYDFRTTLDGVVTCRVAEADTLEIAFLRKEENWGAMRLEDLPVGGMGLSIISKVMDRVIYLTHVGPANLLWMQLRVPEGGPA